MSAFEAVNGIGRFAVVPQGEVFHVLPRDGLMNARTSFETSSRSLLETVSIILRDVGASKRDITLIKRVEPLYPSVMQAARMRGHVVLDAIINPDGTIGEVTVLSSTNGAFAQSAIAAVKQWRYTPLGYQGILTVNVNFTLS
jgi:TonB family protein